MTTERIHTCPTSTCLPAHCPDCTPQRIKIGQVAARLKDTLASAKRHARARRYASALAAIHTAGTEIQKQAKLPPPNPCLAQELGDRMALLSRAARRMRAVVVHWQKLDVFEDSVPEIYQDTDPARLPCEALSREIVALPFHPWAPTPGLILYGDTGLGKSRTAYLLLHRWLLASRDGWTFRVVTGRDVKDAIAKHSRLGTLGEFIDELVKPDVLFVDDLSHGTFTEAYGLALLDIVERRTASRLPLIVSMQTTGRELLKQWTKTDPGLAATARAIVRRLNEFCVAYHFHAPTEPASNAADQVARRPARGAA